MHINLIIQNQKKIVLKGAKILYKRSIERKARKSSRIRKVIPVPSILKGLIEIKKLKKTKRKDWGKVSKKTLLQILTATIGNKKPTQYKTVDLSKTLQPLKILYKL